MENRYLAGVWGIVLAVAVVLALPPRAGAECNAGPEFCRDGGGSVVPDLGGGGSVDSPCWSEELKKDICNDPPAPCPPGQGPVFEFVDDLDGQDDGQLYALGNSEPFVSCGTLTVTKTGYYKIFDVELSESCDTQKDETGYVTIENSCNPGGWAVEGNVGDRYIVMDSDNTPPCTGDGDCSGGRVCRDGNMGAKCCVPSQPTFMGTFLLIAGENNKICLHHFCPGYLEAKGNGTDLGFVSAGCSGSVNSVHFRIDTNAIACEDDTSLKPCTWGCQAGSCLADPCDAKDCPSFCKDGQCLEQNPCDGLGCKHGCKNGRCLQPKSAPGPDGDGDGYPATADCDDANAAVNPGQVEQCNNGIDDDCDGTKDEADCGGAAGDGGTAAGDGGTGVGQTEGGCNCRLGGGPAGSALLLLGLALGWALRRRASPR